MSKYRTTSKYRNESMVVDNIRFASKKEGRRYCDLKVLLKAGVISSLDLQPVYEFNILGIKIAKYRGDFRYIEDGKLVVEDVKGAPLTDVYKIKRQLMLALFNIKIRET